jgi:hypothetical protein
MDFFHLGVGPDHFGDLYIEASSGHDEYQQLKYVDHIRV